ncbi:tripartite tricarboxylate transporter permease [Paracoccus sp. (in: a-proteobacteria)]|uniref:tripartite tricarboxylate transporter permease n=1 Tax=Paracoccus sp. TaxID=267 RepID=UPI0026E05513|nr:tripartite tricarboxylate transporter permease [Paracoccus sp. (in: a-proteobacteria)]MDO5371457.1 tripartite tricarboxylate transporter permease [Paracoccus sp. (in: a-proteobacteria)]
MEFLANLGLGFSTALSVTNVLYCFLGALLGTAIGVLPGLGPVATIAMLLPMTFGLEPVTALIMLAGIFYGAQYGSSTTAILINLPGEASSVVTALDGYRMARQGRAGTALAVAALGSFFAGTFAALIIALFAPALAAVALSFGPHEYFSLMVLGLVASVAIASGSIEKSLAMILLGVLLGLVGQDTQTGVGRLTFGMTDLLDGVEFVAIAMGLFGLAEIIQNLENPAERNSSVGRIGGLRLSRQEFGQMRGPVLRGTAIGSILGILPGGGATIGAFAAYMAEKRLSRTPEKFGQGAIEGVAAPEAANNAGAQTSFIPLLTLGIPANATMAMMTGALILHGVTPGPNIISGEPALFWGLIASMWVGNLMLLVLNLPLIGVWVRMLSVPYRVLFPLIVALSCIGVYTVSNSTFDVMMMVAFGALGYLFFKLECQPTPLLLGLVLGPMLEENLRRAMLTGRGDPTVFLTRPISAGLLILAVICLAAMVLPSVRRTREVAFEE